VSQQEGTGGGIAVDVLTHSTAPLLHACTVTIITQ
jgi:hypothetical protein